MSRDYFGNIINSSASSPTQSITTSSNYSKTAATTTAVVAGTESNNNYNYGVALPDTNGTITRQYGCNSLATNVLHCDPILYPYESVSIKANSDKLFAITKNESDIQYVGGVYDKGQALSFHAYSGEFVNITNSQTVDPNAFTVSFWAKTNPAFANYGQVVSHVNARSTAGWFFDIADTNAQSIRFMVTNSDGKLFMPAESIPLSPDEFTHIVGTFDGSSVVKVYANGKLVGSTP